MSKIVAIPVLALLAAAPRAGTAGELYDAVLLGDAGAVRAQIGRGADIVDPGPLGTPLHVAAIRGEEAIADILIAGGADLEAAREDTGSRPIHDAASYGRLPIVALLLRKGANVNARNNQGLTPLHAATLARHPDIVLLLLNNGADINAVDIRNDAALHQALNNRQHNLALLLIDRGANVVSAGRYGTTPLHWAAAMGFPDIIARLVQGGADLEVQDGAGQTPLAVAIERNEKPSADLLRRLGATR